LEKSGKSRRILLQKTCRNPARYLVSWIFVEQDQDSGWFISAASFL